MDKLLFKRILVFALTLLAVIYVVYLLLSANFEMYPTENAVLTTVTDKINTNGFIIRDESIIENNTSGVLSYSCDDGDDVRAGGEIAKVFSTESDAVAQTTAAQLQSKIDNLKNLQLSNSTGALGIDVINNNIENNLITYIDDVNNSEIGSVKSDADDLLYSINQRMLCTGKISNFDSEIAQLQSQLDELKSSSSQSIGTVKTDKAGYFTEFCDGYENAVNFSNIADMTLDDLKSIKKSDVSSNIAGKVITNKKWYIACEVNEDEAMNLSTWNGNVSVLFSNASNESMPASIYKVHRASQDSNALVLLSCDYMDHSIIEARNEPVEIGLGTYTGLRISRRAIHDDYVTKVTYDDNDVAHKEQKKVQGVYVLYGSEVQFKQISIIHSDNDYVICDTSPADGVLFNGETVSMYDKVIVKGDDLYDGKVIK